MGVNHEALAMTLTPPSPQPENRLRHADLPLLQQFAAGQRDVPGRIRLALDKRDWATAERLARTCRTLSGNIGAADLPNSAGALEHAIKHRMSADVIAPQLMEFDLLLGKLVADLDAALAQYAT